MDPALLSTTWSWRSPFLPTLLKLGESTATEMGKELGAEAGRWASELWQRLARPMSAKPAAREAAEDVAATRTTRTPRRPAAAAPQAPVRGRGPRRRRGPAAASMVQRPARRCRSPLRVNGRWPSAATPSTAASAPATSMTAEGRSGR